MKKYLVSLLMTIPFLTSLAQSDVTIGPNFQLNLQRQDNDADAVILHNAKIDANGNYTWQNTHTSFGSRGILMKYLNGITFFADQIPTTANAVFTPTARMFIGNNGNVGIGTSTPGSLLHLASASGNGTVLRLVSTSTNGRDYGIGSNFITGNGEFGIYDYTAAAERLRISNNGNVGIGTSNPSQKLEINGNFLCNSENSAFGFDAQPVARFGVIKKYGYYPTIASDNSSPIIFSQSNQTGIYTNITTATLSERMRIDVNGNVGIGTPSPDSKLAVAGQIHAQEVKVSITVPGPDYVFEKDYPLTSLEEIKTYIDQNKHLPELPSAKEMEKNGVQLGEMNMLLLKKIEELTLHLIELKKENDNAKTAMKNMQSEINQLKK